MLERSRGVSEAWTTLALDRDKRDWHLDKRIGNLESNRQDDLAGFNLHVEPRAHGVNLQAPCAYGSVH